MQNVRLKVPALIDDRNHSPGDVVKLTDERARQLVRAGHAEEHDDAAEPANAETNPLADAIQPCPPAGPVVNPVDALAPVVADNPGLVALAKSGALSAKSSKVAPRSGRSAPRAEVEPETTAADLAPAEPEAGPARPETATVAPDGERAAGPAPLP